MTTEIAIKLLKGLPTTTIEHINSIDSLLEFISDEKKNKMKTKEQILDEIEKLKVYKVDASPERQIEICLQISLFMWVLGE